MSINPEEGIKSLLITAAVGSDPSGLDPADWQIFIGDVVDQPDQAIIVRQTGGQAPNPKWLLDYPSIQVIVRATRDRYSDARSKAGAVKDALLGLPSQAVDGDQWVAVNMISDVTYVGLDQNQRHMFTVNFALIIEPATGGNRQSL